MTFRPLTAVLLFLCTGLPGVAEPMNVLMFAVDDLRPQIQGYGEVQMKTPHLDRLASRGVLFDNAYCNIAVCGASRASLMKGLRPTPRRFTSYLTWAMKDAGDVPSIPALFKQHGYTTLSNGKIYHHRTDDPEAWSEPAWKSDKPTWVSPENRTLMTRLKKDKNAAWKRAGPTEAADLPDEAYADHQTAEKTIGDLQRLAKQEKPFFLACGFLKPHLPFVAPKKYWNLYPEDAVRLPDNMMFPKNMDEAFQYTWGEMRSYYGVPKKGSVTREMALDLIRGYYACVSFIDAQLGRVLDELDRLGLAENTIVVLWGDHGWQLGEHNMWCKHTNFEVATRVPLIVSAPGMTRGATAPGLVEYIDLYPTLCDLAGLAHPGHLQGQSFAALLKDPTAAGKPMVISRHGGGDSIRIPGFRYSEMRNSGGAGSLRAAALFDLEKDPDENCCVVKDPAYADDVERLKQELTRARYWAKP